MSDDVREIVSEVTGTPVGDLSAASTMGDVSGWDSLATLEILAVVEERCGVTLALEEIVELETIGDWERRVAAGRPAAS